MISGNIRVGVVTNDKAFKSKLALNFKKYSSRVEIVFEKPVDGEISRESLCAKVKSSKVSALFLSSEIKNLEDIIKCIKADVLLHTKIFIVSEGPLEESTSRCMDFADYTLHKDTDLFLVSTRLCSMCDEGFVMKWSRDRVMADLIAQQMLVEIGFNRVLAGYMYLVDALVITLYNKEYTECLSALYYAVAHDTEAMSEKTVEKCIRSAFERAYKRFCDAEAGYKVFGGLDPFCKELFKDGKPSNGKGIPLLTAELERRFKAYILGKSEDR